MLNHLKLGPKFTLLLTIVFVVGILVSGVTLWATIQRQAEEDITTRAELLTQAMNSVRSYTSNHVAPLLKQQLLNNREFVRETVPSFSARRVFEQFRNSPEYSSFFYKEATPNPTNPENRSDEFETELFEQFRQQPDLTVLSGYRTLSGKRLYYTSRPLLLREVSCLQCHSTPTVAPKSQLATYGNKAGFGWRLNEVIAAQTIYVPADEVIAHGRHNMSLIMSIFSAIFAIAIFSINCLLKQAVVQPIKALTRIVRDVGSGALTPEQMQEFESPAIAQVAQRQDEPGQLARTFQYMAREVAEREQNLSQAVEERTAQLSEKTLEAQQASQAKSQFLANISHELRTPLNVILGFSQLMIRSRSLDATQQEYLDTINHSGEHLLGLINNVLELSKIEAGKTILNISDFELNQFLNGLQPMFQFKAQSQGIEFRIERSGFLPKQIQTDEGKLRQVLVNLIGNAIKFTKTGHVTLRIAPDPQVPDTLTFEVEDTGVGIAAAELAQLFQPFIQTEAGRKSQEGTGLGLAIAQQFVHLMGGTLTAQSQVGVGTTFRFRVYAPFIDHDPAPLHAPQFITGLAPEQPIYRILVADDLPENRRLLVELLTPIGFQVREAQNGQEAIALCRSWLPHLVWMDLRMPGVNGYEATQQIRAIEQESEGAEEHSPHPPIKIIALTGSAFEADRRGAIAAGCDDFVRKPFRAETIFEKMAVHLNLRYVYDEVSKPAPPSTPRSENLTSTDLSVMPSEWIEQLGQAATRVNAKEILQLVDQIPPDHSHLIHTLTSWVNNFRFSDIVALTR